jgi:hypothetical protein
VSHHLIVYDRARGEVLEEHEYPATDADDAWAHRARLVSGTIVDPNVEVVLLRASSRADLMKTHVRYFKSVKDIVSAA